MLPVMSTERPLTFIEALFTAVSALSVTGLSIITPGIDLSTAGQLMLLLLIQLGGVGYMVLAVTVFRMLGRQVTLADRLALQDALGLLNPSGIVQLARQVLVTVLAIEAVGALLLWWHWSTNLNLDNAAFLACFHAVSAFCNAGFDLFSGNPNHPYGIPTDNFTLTVFAGLIILGGLGIPVLFDLVTYWKRRKLSLHSKLTLRLVLILLVWGAAGLFFSETRAGGILDELSPGRQVGLSFFQSITARSAGFVAAPQFHEMSAGGNLMMVTLMFVGCAPASMGGGITTGTLLVMVLALWAYSRGQALPVIYGRTIPGNMVRKAAAVLTISLFAVITSTWIILMTHDVTLDRAVFEVVSAFATCGHTLNFTTELNGIGLTVIMIMMFWGRLGALTILFAFTKTSPPGRVRYPEEKILIG